MRAVRLVAMLLAAIVLVVAIAVAVMNHYRDGIARQMAADLLSPYEIRVDDVSVGSLGVERIEFDLIALRRDDGLRVIIEGAKLPVSSGGLEGVSVDIDRVRIEPAVGDPNAGAADIAAILERLLVLPELFPELSVDVAHLTLQGYPELTRLTWRSEAGAQALGVDLEGLRMTAELEAVDAADRSTGSVTLSVGGEEALEILLALDTASDGYEVEGSLELVAEPMLPMLIRAGWLPAELLRLDANLAGSFTAKLSGGDAPLATLALDIVADQGAEVRHGSEGGGAINVFLLEGNEAGVELEYPSGDWRISVAEARLQVDHDVISGLRLRLQDLVCAPGIDCAMRGSFERITVGNGVGLKGGAEGLALSLRDGSWRVELAEALIDADGITGPADLAAALSIRASAVTAEGTETVQGNLELLSPDIRLSGRSVSVPAARGAFGRNANDLTLDLEFGERDKAQFADVSVTHDLVTDATRLLIDDAQINFSDQALSALIEGWSEDWDLVAGSWRASGEFLRGKDGAVEFSARQALDAVAGNYGDIAFTGLNAALTTAETAWPPAEPQAVFVSVGVVDVGFPLRNLESVLTVDAGSRRIAVDETHVEALGGNVEVEPFVFDPEADTLSVVLRPDAVQLPLMAELANFEALKVLGSVSGVIPVTMGPNGVTVEDGRLIGDAPGGTIRYEAAGCTEEVMQARTGLDYARCVLTHYEFESLTSDVSYSEDGNLVIDMRLEGMNPQHDPDQPVNLNPTLTTNVIDLIRSLQAARSIEDVFNRQVN